MGQLQVMAGSRPDVSMTRQELIEFLTPKRPVVVAALEDGRPVGTIADAFLVGDVLQVTLRHGDPIDGLLRADPRVCVISEQFPTYYEIKGVSAHGHAEFHSASTFLLPLDDVTTFDFGKLPRRGAGSGKDR